MINTINQFPDEGSADGTGTRHVGKFVSLPPGRGVVMKPPYRADHVGSLLRPQKLADARSQILPTDELKAIEDDCIRDVVRMQESAGLKSVTDGEFRRESWNFDFLSGFDGLELIEESQGPAFSGGYRPQSLNTKAKIANPNGVMVESFKFLKSVSTATAKLCIPSPSLAYHRGGRALISEEIYPDLAEFWQDLWAAYRAEISMLGEAGCEYLQLDDTTYAMLCDPKVRDQMKARGEDADDLVATYADGVNQVLSERPDGMAVTVHMCRGNFQSSWIAEGGYEPVAEEMFSTINVDGFFMEWDSDRAGGFEPLRFVRDDQIVVVGLITSKTPELESKDDIKRRLDEAAKFVPLERLCLSPQCGFASTQHGNKLTEDEQRRKLELVVEIADEVWG